MKDTLAIIALILVSAGFYALTLRGVSGNIDPAQIKGRLDTATKPFELSPERGRFAGVLSLAERGTYDLGPDLAGVVYPDVGYYENRYYSFFAPGMAFMALPFYDIGRQFGHAQLFTFGFVSVAAIACLVFLYLIARRIFVLPIAASLIAPLVYGFATTSWSYAITLYQHHVTSLLIFSGFFAAWKFGRQGKYSWLWGTWVLAAYGLAISIDYPNAVLMLPVAAYFFYNATKVTRTSGGLKIALRPSVAAGLLVFASIAVWNLKFNQENFGNWKTLAGQLPGFTLEQQDVPPDSQVLVREAIAGKGLVGFFSDTNVPKSFYTLFFSSDRGLLFFSPVMALGLLGLLKAKRQAGREKYFLMGIAATGVLVYSSWGDPWGGWAYGPRYLIPSMGILALYVAYWLHLNKGKVWPAVVAFVAFLIRPFSSEMRLRRPVTCD